MWWEDPHKKDPINENTYGEYWDGVKWVYGRYLRGGCYIPIAPSCKDCIWEHVPGPAASRLRHPFGNAERTYIGYQNGQYAVWNPVDESRETLRCSHLYHVVRHERG